MPKPRRPRVSSEPRRAAWGQRSKSLGRRARAPVGGEGCPRAPATRLSGGCPWAVGWARSSAPAGSGCPSPAAAPVAVSVRVLRSCISGQRSGQVEGGGPNGDARQVERAEASRPEGSAPCAAGASFRFGRGLGSWPNRGGRTGPGRARSPARAGAGNPGAAV